MMSMSTPMFTRPIHAAQTLALGVLPLCLALAGSPVAAQTVATPNATTAAVPSTAACSDLLNRRLPRLQDEKPQDLCQWQGQVVLVVNTASFCGFTSQYKGLEALYAKYKDRGLVVLGFPSNDFGSQEPGSNKDIADFCENTFGVKFPMFAKTQVKPGAGQSPLFTALVQASGTTPKWNFYKYLIARDGKTVKAFNAMTAPEDAGFVKEVERLLSQK